MIALPFYSQIHTKEETEFGGYLKNFYLYLEFHTVQVVHCSSNSAVIVNTADSLSTASCAGTDKRKVGFSSFPQ